MPKITIDSKDYDTDLLSDEAKAQLINIQFVDAEMMRIQGHLAALQTARNAYATEMKRVLDLTGGDTIKFN